MVWPSHTYCIWPCQARQKYSCTVRSIHGLQQLSNKPGWPGQTSGHWCKRGATREVGRNIRGTAWQERDGMMWEAAVQQERWWCSKRGGNSTTSQCKRDVGARIDKVMQQPASTREVQWDMRDGGVTMIYALVRADWGLVWYIKSEV